MMNNLISGGLSLCERFFPAIMAAGFTGATLSSAVELVPGA
jgi:hypothetical protein